MAKTARVSATDNEQIVWLCTMSSTLRNLIIALKRRRKRYPSLAQLASVIEKETQPALDRAIGQAVANITFPP
jgi:hypothetical protein